MTFPRLTLIALAAAALAACGGGDLEQGAPVQAKQAAAVMRGSDVTIQAAQVVELSATAAAMQSVAFHNGAAFVSLFNTTKDATTVLKTGLPLSAKSAWNASDLGKCVLPAYSGENGFARAPTLKDVNGKLWMMQRWMGSKTVEEHSLCSLDDQQSVFTAQDKGLVKCDDTLGCHTLSPSDMKVVRNRFITNAGGADNVLVSETRAASWRVLTGHFDSMACYDAKFEVVGDRLFVGGECPLDSAYLRSYQLTPYTLELKSKDPLPMILPDLENRNIQFIERVPGTNLVFVGVEGGLLRSIDGGKSFKFVIHHAISKPEVTPVSVDIGAGIGDDVPKNYPYIWNFLSPVGQPNTIVVAGFDKPAQRPYLAWSADGGETWTDLSSNLPGYAAASGGQVTSLIEGSAGQVLITVNEQADAKGHLLQVTLGK